MQKNTQLMCTFTNQIDLDKTLEKIKLVYTIVYNKIFVLQNVDDKKELVCSYNIDMNIPIIDPGEIPINTISVHRKKETNTLYTINALNKLIMSLNNGILNKKFKINWNDYRNSILVLPYNTLKKINTKLFNIIEV